MDDAELGGDEDNGGVVERPRRVRAILVDDEDEFDAVKGSDFKVTPRKEVGEKRPVDEESGGTRSRTKLKKLRVTDSESESENPGDEGDDEEDEEDSSVDEDSSDEQESEDDDGYSLYWRVDNALQRDKEIDFSAEKHLRMEDYFERYVEMMARVHTDKEALRVWWKNPRGKEAVKFSAASKKVRFNVSRLHNFVIRIL